MTSAITGIIIIVLAIFLKDLLKNKKEIANSKGVESKYYHLIELIINGDSNPRIIKKTKSQLTIQAGGPSTVVLYNLVFAFNSLTVVYSINSYVTGKHSFELVFRDNLTQEEMYEQICVKINELAQNM